MITPEQATAFESCIEAGGVAVFPADTVYGLACDPLSDAAVERLYALKGRPAVKPAAIMFFALQLALDQLPEIGPRTRAAFESLLPGAVTLLLPNPEQLFPLACGPDIATLGLRVPALTQPLAALASVRTPVLQSSANLAGGDDARALTQVQPEIRGGADHEIDGGELPGTPSTVVDLRSLESEGRWKVLRAGAVSAGEVAQRLG